MGAGSPADIVNGHDDGDDGDDDGGGREFDEPTSTIRVYYTLYSC